MWHTADMCSAEPSSESTEILERRRVMKPWMLEPGTDGKSSMAAFSLG